MAVWAAGADKGGGWSLESVRDVVSCTRAERADAVYVAKDNATIIVAGSFKHGYLRSFARADPGLDPGLASASALPSSAAAASGTDLDASTDAASQASGASYSCSLLMDDGRVLVASVR